MNRYRVPYFIAINLILIAVGIYWMYHCRIWTDEGWYYHGAVLFSKGHHPYIDFFYHRLPLHVEFYGSLFKLLGSSFMTGRFISLSLFILLANSTAYLIYRITNDVRMTALGYIAFLIPISLYGYLTNATYALNALLIVLSACVLISSMRITWRLFLFVLLNMLILSNRYLVDYQAIFVLVLVIGMIIHFRRNAEAMVAILSAILIGLAYIFKYYIIYGDTNIFYDTITFNFTLTSILKGQGVVLPVGLLNDIIQFIKLRFYEFDSYYPFNVLSLIAIGILCYKLFKRGWNEMKSGKTLTLYYVSLIIILNLGFYYLSLGDWPVGKLYIFPFMIVLCVWLMSELLGTFVVLKSGYATGIVVVVFSGLFLFQGMSSSQEYVSTHYEKSDVAKLQEVSELIRHHVRDAGGMILSFTPVLANSGLINEPRLNMEMFAYRSDLDREDVEKRRLMNREILLSNLKAKKYEAVVLSDDRFYNGKNVAKVVAAHRGDIVLSVEDNYDFVAVCPSGNFRGEFKIFVPKRGSAKGRKG